MKPFLDFAGLLMGQQQCTAAASFDGPFNGMTILNERHVCRPESETDVMQAVLSHMIYTG